LPCFGCFFADFFAGCLEVDAFAFLGFMLVVAPHWTCPSSLNRASLFGWWCLVGLFVDYIY
jgi:hypothetical protein